MHTVTLVGLISKICSLLENCEAEVNHDYQGCIVYIDIPFTPRLNHTEQQQLQKAQFARDAFPPLSFENEIPALESASPFRFFFSGWRALDSRLEAPRFLRSQLCNAFYLFTKANTHLPWRQG